MSDRSCQGLQLLNAFVMLETELWLGITGRVILGGKQPQFGSKSCKVEIDGGGVWKRHADQMTTTGVGNGIEDEPVSMAVEPEWRLDRQVPEVLPDSSDTEPGDMPGKLTSVTTTSPLAPHQRRNHLDNGQLSLGEKLIGHCGCLFEMEVVAMDETTTDRTVDELRAIFAQRGIPLQMVTDNGPQFTSAGFKLFPGLE
ncbi:hypothetical protein EMCRGX_G011616 [Ephydatia muelleri]